MADKEASTVFHDKLEEKNSITSNNQRLQSASDNDRRSKRFCSITVLCVSFM